MLLKGEQNDFKAKQPRVRYYTMGSNKWQQAESFPLPNTEIKDFFLASAGKANTRNGDGALSLTPPSKDNPDAFTYDPMNPVGSYGVMFAVLVMRCKVAALINHKWNYAMIF